MRLLWRRRFKRRKRDSETSMRWHVLYGILVIGFVVLLGYGVWYVTRMPYFTISDVVITGGETVSHEDVRTQINGELSGSRFGLVPYRFKWLYPHDRIVAALEDESRIYNVEVVREGKELRVSFDEHVPHALWCLTDLNTSPCYFINESGYAFAEAPLLEGGSFVRYILENETTLGEQQILDASTLKAIESFIAVLDDELGFRTASVIRTKDGDTNYRISGGGYLYTSPGISFGEIYENLKSILDSEEFGHLTPGNFNYIDLRFGNKVYVNEELNVESVETENGQKEEPLPEGDAALDE